MQSATLTFFSSFIHAGIISIINTSSSSSNFLYGISHEMGSYSSPNPLAIIRGKFYSLILLLYLSLVFCSIYFLQGTEFVLVLHARVFASQVENWWFKDNFIPMFSKGSEDIHQLVDPTLRIRDWSCWEWTESCGCCGRVECWTNDRTLDLQSVILA